MKNVIFTKFFKVEDLDKVQTLKNFGRVLFVDTPATQLLVQFVKELVELGVNVIIRDHHDVDEVRSTRDQEVRDSVECLRALVPEAVISNRKANPACASLVDLGEFSDEEVFIIADPDLDGLTASLKARGLTYPGLEEDSSILDGPRNMRTPENLSPTGLLMERSMSTLPGFDHPKFEKFRDELFDTIASAVGGDQSAIQTLTDKVKIYEQQVAVAHILAETSVEVVPGVRLVDVRESQRFDLGTLSGLLGVFTGTKVTAILKKDGPVAKVFGSQVSLAVKKEFQQEINLQGLLPGGFESSPEAGIISNTSFLLHVSEEIWNMEVLPALRTLLS